MTSFDSVSAAFKWAKDNGAEYRVCPGDYTAQVYRRSHFDPRCWSVTTLRHSKFWRGCWTDGVWTLTQELPREAVPIDSPHLPPTTEETY
jgi:hypothetical protein